MKSTEEHNVKTTEKKARAAEVSAIRFIKAIRQKEIIIRRNKWRDDPRLTFENHKFKGYLGSGAWGDVLLAMNTETNKHYALKLLLNLTKFDRSDTLPEGALEPPLTASSDATKSSSHSETRISLRYIRNGHPHICNLEAFVQYKPGYGDEEYAMGLYFEYCDAGNLSILSKSFRTRGIKPPELFIWQVFYEMISGIAFLHNEHPDYNTKVENLGREAIFHDDLRSENVFLQWGSDKEDGYPHVKIGDFGTSFTEPLGGHISDPEFDPPTSQDEGWGPQPVKLKTEVWWVAAIVYELARTGVVLDNILKLSLQQSREQFRKIVPIDGHLSEGLDQVIRGTLTPELEKRPFSGEVYLNLKSAFEERVGLMYRKLRDWAGEMTLAHVFDEDMMKKVEEGGVEVELGLGLAGDINKNVI